MTEPREARKDEPECGLCGRRHPRLTRNETCPADPAVPRSDEPRDKIEAFVAAFAALPDDARAAVLANVAPTSPAGDGLLRERIRPIVADWFDTGYEAGKLDADVLTDRVLAALASQAPPPEIDVDTFIAGLDSPNHSDVSRRAWIALFYRDLQRVALRASPLSPQTAPETE